MGPFLSSYGNGKVDDRLLRMLAAMMMKSQTLMKRDE